MVSADLNRQTDPVEEVEEDEPKERIRKKTQKEVALAGDDCHEPNPALPYGSSLC